MTGSRPARRRTRSPCAVRLLAVKGMGHILLGQQLGAQRPLLPTSLAGRRPTLRAPHRPPTALAACGVALAPQKRQPAKTARTGTHAARSPTASPLPSLTPASPSQ